jgi:alpha-L-fucosidase
MNAHWGVGARDLTFKSPATVIERLCACRKVGANYLLNVGPQADGSLGGYEVELLKLVGRWIREVGGSIYSGKPVPAQCGGRDFLLEAGGRLYYFAHALNVRGDKHVVPGGGNGPRSITGLHRKLAAARWLDNDAGIPLLENHDGSVTVLDCEGYDYGTNLVVRVAELTEAQ